MNYSSGREIKTGFIGAGKVGCSLGKLLAQSGASLSGYFSRSIQSARWAADFTGSAAYESTAELAADCDLIFLTVPDGMITPVFRELSRTADLNGKMLLHCSGALSAQAAFPGMAEGTCGASVHPIFPVSSKEKVWQELKDAYFCIEGDEPAAEAAEALLTLCGVHFQRIRPENKTKYHAGCVFASNLVCALMQESFDLLSDCGFTQEGAREALRPLVTSNLNHVLDDGAVKALTGPVERCDTGTVEKHLQVLGGEQESVYRILSAALTEIAQEKHPETDYTALRNLLETGDVGKD